MSGPSESNGPAEVVDSHHHLWRVVPGRTTWPTPSDGELYRDYEWNELEPQLDEAAVSRTVLVQTEDSHADTDFLLEQQRRHPRISGVVGWLPLTDPAACERRLDRLEGAGSRLAGVRCLIHHYADVDWLARPDVDRGLGWLEARGIPFDVVSDRPAQLRHVARIADRHPDLSLVIDHLSKPPFDDRASPWWRELARAAERPNVSAKVSGLYPPAADRRTLMRTIRPHFDLALTLFGPSRLMIGSDWPVCVTSGSYAETWSRLRGLAGQLQPAEQDALLGGTADSFYRLARRG